MAQIALEIIDGPNKGQIFPIELGYKLGNGLGEAKTEVNLPAKNMSILHAKVLNNEKAQLVLVALNPNVEFHVNSQKVSRVILVHGQVFKMADMLIKVVSNIEKSPKFEQKLLPPADLLKQSEGFMDLLSHIATIQKPSVESLETLLKSCVPQIPKNEAVINVIAFRNPLQMRFTQGLQFEESYIIGWGPRKFGKNSLEFSLIDPAAPNLAFTLSPGPHGEYLYSTQHPNIVFINGQKEKKAIVNSGDRIKFGDTIIEILELEYF